MKLYLQNKYKSLEPFEYELNDFTILTGVNGAGKTHILEAIKENCIQIAGFRNDFDEIKLVTNTILSPTNNPRISRSLWSNHIQSIFNQILTYKDQKKKDITLKLSDHFTTPAQITQFERMENESGKKILDMSWLDFYDNYPLFDSLDNNDLFIQGFTNIFKRYSDKFFDNKFNKFLKIEEKMNHFSFLSDEEFKIKYGEAPWDLVNEIIAEAELPFSINKPNNFQTDSLFELKLIRNDDGTEIDFTDLSSGEKILMSFVFAVYNTNYLTNIPRLVLMDEPDASLHPSMIKQFLNIIQNVFIKRDIKVIITTHSPSTVGLANEENIFQVNRNGQKIKKVSKDEAIRNLTVGVPSLSIIYKNRRQVFVESPNDVMYYDSIYKSISKFLNPEISLTFISSGESRTNNYGSSVSSCEQVKKIVALLRDGGNNTVWGLIDWDINNQEKDSLIVLGNSNRYSIENYILDPIFIIGILLRNKILKSEDFEFPEKTYHQEFRKLSISQLQIAIDIFVDRIADKINESNLEKTNVQLINKINLKLPNWYLNIKGHKLEKAILEAFPKLNDIKKNKEELLKREIIDKIIDDIPDFLSIDILETFKKLQSI